MMMTTLWISAVYAGGQNEADTKSVPMNEDTLMLESMTLDEMKQLAAPDLDETALQEASSPSDEAFYGLTGDSGFGIGGENGAASEYLLRDAANASLLNRQRIRSTDEIAVDVDEAVELALKYNLSLKGEQLELVKKRRAMSTVWNNFIPTVQVSSSLIRGNSAPAGMGGWLPYQNNVPMIDPSSGDVIPFSTANSGMMYVEQDMSPWNAAAGINFDLMLNLALFDGITSTKLDYASGLISYEQAKQKLERDVRKSFYNLVLMQENRELFLQQISAAEDRYEQAKINYDNGLVPELSVLSARVAWENLKPALESMDLGYQQTLAGFKMTLGLAQSTKLEIDGSIEADPVELEAEPLIEEYLAGRLDLKSMLYGIKSIETAKTSTMKRAFTPNLMLSWNADPSMNDPFDTNWFDTDWNQQSGMFRLTVAMNLEGLLPNSKMRVSLAELDEQKQSLQLGLMQAIEGAEMEISSLVRSLNKSRSSMDSLRLNTEMAERAYQLAEEAYNAGSRELLEVQNAEIELNKAQYELLKEKYNYVTGLLDLEYALNTSLEQIMDGKDE
ncbi:MAG: TolC family protein [Spirochaetia bacterium]|nr:TolC family protein [Spirochaetia bacterium]